MDPGGVVVLCAVWTGLEIFGGSIAWATVFAALGACFAYCFFMTFQPAGEALASLRAALPAIAVGDSGGWA